MKFMLVGLTGAGTIMCLFDWAAIVWHLGNKIPGKSKVGPGEESSRQSHTQPLINLECKNLRLLLSLWHWVVSVTFVHGMPPSAHRRLFFLFCF